MNEELFTLEFRRIILRYQLKTNAPLWTDSDETDWALAKQSEGGFSVWFARMFGRE